jgi:hypothetical protein
LKAATAWARRTTGILIGGVEVIFVVHPFQSSSLTFSSSFLGASVQFRARVLHRDVTVEQGPEI